MAALDPFHIKSHRRNGIDRKFTTRQNSQYRRFACILQPEHGNVHFRGPEHAQQPAVEAVEEASHEGCRAYQRGHSAAAPNGERCFSQAMG